MQPTPPPSPDVQQLVPPLPVSLRGQNNDDIVAGKAPFPSKYSRDIDQLEGWILQMGDYFVVIKVENSAQ